MRQLESLIGEWLELAQIGEYRAVVPRGQYSTGDWAIYIPEQAIVPDELLAELGLTRRLAGQRKNRVKATRFRGELSQGLVCWLRVLAGVDLARRIKAMLMKIRILSDLHLEFEQWSPPKEDADVIVLAGDIDVGIHGVEWARRSFPSSPVVYVPGNHEFYGCHMQDLMEELLAQGKRFGVDVLDGRDLSIDGVRFLGATLWTDFALQGSDRGSIDHAMADAQYGMNDFRLIRYGEGRMFRPADARAIHLTQVRWLRAKLAEEFVGSTVVVTHHLPHRRSIHPKYEGSDLNPSFASELGDLMGPSVSLWIHGHTHESFDYVVNGTRVVCNPRGYFPMELNAAFDPVLKINLQSLAVPARMS